MSKATKISGRHLCHRQEHWILSMTQYFQI